MTEQVPATGVTKMTNEVADLIDSLSYYYDLMKEMQERGFHLQGVQLLSKTVRITFEAKEIKTSFWKQDLEKVSELELEVRSVDLEDTAFPETRVTFTLPRKGEKDD